MFVLHLEQVFKLINGFRFFSPTGDNVMHLTYVGNCVEQKENE